MNIEWGSVITVVVTALLTYLGTRTQTKGILQSKQVEVGSATEGIYIAQINTLFEERDKQAEHLRNEVDKMRNENQDMIRQFEELQKEFNEFRSSHDLEVETYRLSLLEKEEHIEELQMEVDVLKEEIEVLENELQSSECGSKNEEIEP